MVLGVPEAWRQCYSSSMNSGKIVADGTGGRDGTGKSKVLQEVLADLKSHAANIYLWLTSENRELDGCWLVLFIFFTLIWLWPEDWIRLWTNFSLSTSFSISSVLIRWRPAECYDVGLSESNVSHVVENAFGRNMANTRQHRRLNICGHLLVEIMSLSIQPIFLQILRRPNALAQCICDRVWYHLPQRKPRKKRRRYY